MPCQYCPWCDRGGCRGPVEADRCRARRPLRLDELVGDSGRRRRSRRWRNGLRRLLDDAKVPRIDYHLLRGGRRLGRRHAIYGLLLDDDRLGAGIAGDLHLVAIARVQDERDDLRPRRTTHHGRRRSHHRLGRHGDHLRRRFLRLLVNYIRAHVPLVQLHLHGLVDNHIAAD